MPDPSVSVLLPTNTLNPWVDAAVESVLAQDYGNYEVIVVHDGIDPQRERTWAQDPRVRCIRTETSQGLASALVHGADRADGEYIARLDGDDLAQPARLRTQVEFMGAHPEVAVCGTLAHRIDEHGVRTGVLGREKVADLRSELLSRNVLIHSSTMFSTSVYRRAGGYDPRLRQMEDYHLWVRMAMLGEVHVLQKRLTDYRVHQGQMNRGASPTGDYVHLVLAARLELAEFLGHSHLAQRARNEVWRAAQLARYRGWRTPGYAR